MKKGFTLIEVMVALTLFSVIVAIAVGGFARALHTQREVTVLVAAQSNADTALEQMAREMRTGYLFCATTSSTLSNPVPNATCGATDSATGAAYCAAGANNTWVCNNLLNFYNAQSILTTYSLENGVLMRNNSPITGDNVKIKYLTFVLLGQLQGDHWNPRITIAMGVAPSSTDPALQNDVMNLQTTVSAREADYGAGIIGY